MWLFLTTPMWAGGSISVSDNDRNDLVKTLAEACQKTGWQVHAYCLMPSHYRVVLGTPEPNLVPAWPGCRAPARFPKAIAGRVGLGSSKAANAKLHASMRHTQPQAAAPSQGRLGF